MDIEKITRGLVIREPWASMIVDGKKVWEIRGSCTKIRGPIAIIAGGTGQIIGVSVLQGVRGPLTLDDYNFGYKQWGGSQAGSASLPYPNTYAWELIDSDRLPEPVSYSHLQGAVIWVKLQSKTIAALEKMLLQKVTEC